MTKETVNLEDITKKFHNKYKPVSDRFHGLFFKDDERNTFAFSRLPILDDRDPVQEWNNYSLRNEIILKVISWKFTWK